ncbi:MAG: hypothetical protein LBI14_02815 [Treponema sp.]|nr:hypothetical protein [Treponema sp.]
MKEFDRTASLGVAVREYPTQSGPVDYLLFIDGKPVEVIEAKAANKGVLISTVAEQSQRYITSGLKYLDTITIRFAYESTGVITLFRDINDQTVVFELLHVGAGVFRNQTRSFFLVKHHVERLKHCVGVSVLVVGACYLLSVIVCFLALSLKPNSHLSISFSIILSRATVPKKGSNWFATYFWQLLK